ncbi:hypothetical protein ON010_g12579 [Phytophthora cinnamomi]|nr:hypothetical protein ON010_g12579 [Phytophthora cinnamomi]
MSWNWWGWDNGWGYNGTWGTIILGGVETTITGSIESVNHSFRISTSTTSSVGGGSVGVCGGSIGAGAGAAGAALSGAGSSDAATDGGIARAGRARVTSWTFLHARVWQRLDDTLVQLPTEACLKHDRGDEVAIPLREELEPSESGHDATNAEGRIDSSGDESAIDVDGEDITECNNSYSWQSCTHWTWHSRILMEHVQIKFAQSAVPNEAAVFARNPARGPKRSCRQQQVRESVLRSRWMEITPISFSRPHAFEPRHCDREEKRLGSLGSHDGTSGFLGGVTKCKQAVAASIVRVEEAPRGLWEFIAIPEQEAGVHGLSPIKQWTGQEICKRKPGSNSFLLYCDE